MSQLEEIPPITDPLGQYWEQPCRSKILIDDTIAVMDKQTFNELMAYDSSIPSGVYVGKMWSRSTDFARQLCWYDNYPEQPDRCLIKSREVVFL